MNTDESDANVEGVTRSGARYGVGPVLGRLQLHVTCNLSTVM